MRCLIHQAERCVFCVWFASGDIVKVRAAASRAARVAETDGLPPNPAARPADPPPPPLSSEPRFHWVRAMKACPARVKAGCGCQGRYECRLREMAEVSPEDCRICLTTRETTRE